MSHYDTEIPACFMILEPIFGHKRLDILYTDHESELTTNCLHAIRPHHTQVPVYTLAIREMTEAEIGDRYGSDDDEDLKFELVSVDSCVHIDRADAFRLFNEGDIDFWQGREIVPISD